MIFSTRGSTPLLKDTITLKRPDYDPSLSDLSATPDETADNSDDSQFGEKIVFTLYFIMPY